MSEPVDGMIKIGNLRFCCHCLNIMEVLSESNRLKWRCSIKCPESVIKDTQRQANLDQDQSLVILSETVDDDLNINVKPYNEFVIYDQTLLRCRKQCINQECRSHLNADGMAEMVIYKQNIATADNCFICTICRSKLIDTKY